MYKTAQRPVASPPSRPFQARPAAPPAAAPQNAVKGHAGAATTEKGTITRTATVGDKKGSREILRSIEALGTDVPHGDARVSVRQGFKLSGPHGSYSSGEVTVEVTLPCQSDPASVAGAMAAAAEYGNAGLDVLVAETMDSLNGLFK